MASSSAKTVATYLNELPPARRAAIAAVRKIILQHLPAGYVEVMRWGMITYEIPLSRFSDTYNGKPLSYMALAAQKNYSALYLSCGYINPGRIKKAFLDAGKKLDMGKCCIRFKQADALPLDALGKIIADMGPESLIKAYQARGRSKVSDKK